MNKPNILTLPNGIRIAHKETPSNSVAHCGLILDIGSRDESPGEQGLAHFWEHMVFKGTRKRKAFHILNRLESVGGELNAYTTKEKIAFYASVLNVHFENAVELLKDITFNSTFPQKQIEKERGVILEEMSMYKDSPEDSLHDEFDELVFGNHPLGYNILGTSKHVKKFEQKDFKNFLRNHIDTSRIVFSSVGNLPWEKVKRVAEKYFSDIPQKSSTFKRDPFVKNGVMERTVQKPMNQSLCAIGRPVFSYHDPRKLELILLNNLLGGPALNSRLNMALRERKGYVYSVESSYMAYEDTGLFVVFFGTEPGQLNKSLKLIWKEMDELKRKPLGKLQLKSAKEQLKGQIAISEEKNIGFMLMMGKSLLNYNKIETLDELFQKIDSITAEDLQDLANDLLVQNEFSQLFYKP